MANKASSIVRDSAPVGAAMTISQLGNLGWMRNSSCGPWSVTVDEQGYFHIELPWGFAYRVNYAGNLGSEYWSLQRNTVPGGLYTREQILVSDPAF